MGADEVARHGMLWRRENTVDTILLDDPALLHHSYPGRQACHHAHVVSDQQNAKTTIDNEALE